MDELARRRAMQGSDSLLWAPLDALEDTIERIKSGELNPDKIAIHMLEKPDSLGNNQHVYVAAGLDYPNHIALLNVALRRTLHEWMEVT